MMTAKVSRKDYDKAKQVGLAKMIRTFTQIYNNLCKMCKLKATRNPRMTINKYCKDCQDMIKQKGSKLQ